MKIKLTPELAYIIGFWRKRRTFEGIGVRGDKEHVEIFSKEVLEKGLTTPDKLLSEDKKVWFFHSAYRKFFQDIEKEQLERFKYLNETHHPEPLPDEVLAELDRILAAAERELG